MAHFFFGLCIFRLVLPIILAICAIFRPSILSGIYLLFLFYFPFVPAPRHETMRGHTGIYLKIMMVISSLTLLAQGAFQIFLLAEPPYGHFLQNCTLYETIFRHIGLVRLDHLSPIDVLTWVYPEVLMFLTSIVIYFACQKLSFVETNDLEMSHLVPKKKQTYKKYMSLFTSVGRYIVLVCMCLAAIIKPSVPGGIYFLIFLSSATWWACYKKLEKGFAYLTRCLLVVLLAHMIALYAYQTQFVQELLPKDNLIARLLGLVPIFYSSCSTDPRDIKWVPDQLWDTYVYPLALYLLYAAIIFESKLLLNPQVSNDQTAEQSERTPLMKGISPSRRYGSSNLGARKHSIIQDSLGSVTVPTDPTEDIPMDQLDITEEDYKPTVCENVLYGLETFLQVIIKSSYIGTNIIMMTWAITYLSWLTFILLIWANLLWLVPNQRKSMLRSSPFLVLYAWFLLISAYIFCLDLTELPDKIDNINLTQIGFERIRVLPINSLTVKCLFTAMFWITLRQYRQESIAEKQSSALADMVAPLQVTVGTAAGVEKEPVKALEVFGEYFRSFLASIWIWIVAATLFSVAITGQRMTGFRIVYMALFLIFVITFQLSFRIWRKIMFGFWLVVIIFSMLMLVMVYTYQFDHFQDYWTALGVALEQQADIGLEKYETKQLFVRLVTPTFFVIITVIQLHYFHHDFMKIYEPDPEPEGEDAVADGKEKKEESTSVKFDISELGNISSVEVQELFGRYVKKIKYYLNLFFLFLELHMVKAVLFIGILACLFRPCALDLVVVILLVFGTCLGKRMQAVTIYSSSVFLSLLLLTRMIYQVKYFRPEKWNTTCYEKISDNVTFNYTTNNAEWLGFNKLMDNQSMMNYIKWDFFYILFTTFWTTVKIRQINLRKRMGIPNAQVEVMFPNITRADADKNLTCFTKYMFNYGYYKFGLEISLIFTILLIGYRMDFYALMYSFWLCVLFAMHREKMAKIWSVFLMFIAVLIPLQYVMVIGLPPSLCIIFPWDTNEILKKFQEWAFLMDTLNPPPAKKLLFDYLLLMCVCRQAIVFKKEVQQRTLGVQYPGGSNEVIIHYAEDPNFENPVPDFITYCRSYLDIFKRSVLLSLLWITLAIIFLAGTNRVNIFSIGYLIGAFAFLWQGTDMYLWPIPKILRAWNYLIAYNVFVITLKALLQIIGCLFIQELTSNVCWPIQLFAIGCVNKFDTAEQPDEPECKVPREYIGLVWDGLSFTFLILQRRVFHSYNFFHMIDEAKASTILASRGAELIEELRAKRMHEQEENEKKVLEKIKTKMDRIKASQQRIQGAAFRDAPTHHMETSGLRKRRNEPHSHVEAVRSGDYYMFDDLHIEDFEPLDSDLQPEQPEDDTDHAQKGQTVGEFLSSAMKTDMSSAVGTARMASKMSGQSARRGSFPARQKSIMSGRSILSTKSHASDKDVISAPARVEDFTPKTVKIAEEPKPSTSHDEDITEMDDDVTLKDESTEHKGWYKSLIEFLVFIFYFIDSIMNSLTRFFNGYTRDYRYVLRVLRKNKKNLKETTSYNVGKRVGSSQIWQPAGSFHELLEAQSKSISLVQIMEEEEETEMSSYDQPTILRLLLSIWYMITSKSELLCYLTVFLNQINSATFLSLPLPLMVFLWGSLTIPRPTKTFWVTIIAYTEVIVLIKCMFQFDIIPWNRKSEFMNDPLYPPRIIGIERKPNYAVWDLLLLLVVFFHRFMLKSMGLWTSSTPPSQRTEPGYFKSDENGQLIPINESKMNKLRKSSIYTEYSNDGKNDEISSQFSQTESLSSRQNTDIGLDTIDMDGVVRVTADKVDPSDHFPQSLQLAATKYSETFKSFLSQLIQPASRVAADVYSYMFLCDFFNFFVLLLGYTSFGTNQAEGGGVASYLEDNKIPVLFLLMLIIQFMLIIIDRGIYLRKNLLAKIIFQFGLIIFLHIWLFVLYPTITERSFNSVLPPQLYYMVKCFYLLLSAYQIRCGYPTRILGNFLCKGYNYFNLFSFKAFLGIPFLFELRTVMDWMWTDTSMTVFDWIKMEDIFAHIFQLKCNRHCEAEYPQPRGEKKNAFSKYFMGGTILLIIIGIIWFPLVFFSLGNAVGKPNIPYDVTFDLRIGPYDPVYTMSAQDNNIFQFDDADYDQMLNAYYNKKSALTFISNYEGNDIAAVKLSTDSANIWTISPPDRNRMIEEVKSDNPISVRLNYKVSHKPSKSEDSGILSNFVQINLPAINENGERNPERIHLLEMLTTDNQTNPVLLQRILPKFLKVSNNGNVKPVGNLMDSLMPGDEANYYRNMSLKLHKDNHESPGQTIDWWQLNENCQDKNYVKYLSKLPHADNCTYTVIYTFNDKIFPATLSLITGGGIIGLYTTFVLLVFHFLRGFFTGQCTKIMYEDLPYIDRIFQLCLDIYLVRESREFVLEEDLFAKLIFLFRSPETLIKWTRPLEEGNPEDDEDD